MNTVFGIHRGILVGGIAGILVGGFWLAATASSFEPSPFLLLIGAAILVVGQCALLVALIGYGVSLGLARDRAIKAMYEQD